MDLATNIGERGWYFRLGLLCGLIALTLGLGSLAGYQTGPNIGPRNGSTASAPAAESLGSSAETLASGFAGSPALAGENLPLETDTAYNDGVSEPQSNVIYARYPVKNGDTLELILIRAGAERGEAYAATRALSKLFNPRRLQIGQEISVGFTQSTTNHEKKQLASLALQADIDRIILAKRAPDGSFIPKQEQLPLETLKVRSRGLISDNLFLSAERVGVPAAVIVELIRIFSFDVDFQREIRRGDAFEVYFEHYYDADNRPIKTGNILYGALTLRGKTLRLYRYKPSDQQEAEYFAADGGSARKTLMKTPIDGARLTSRYGMRHHPILGYGRMHRGIDFGARSGTPIMAAGDGVINMAAWNGGYGRYVRIRHNGTYTTAYAHLSKFGRGIKKGRRVKQGQIIGYVGSSGQSTGPHLHYEVLVDGKQANPLKLRLPKGRNLKGAELARFSELVGARNREIAAAPFLHQVAQNIETNLPNDIPSR